MRNQPLWVIILSYQVSLVIRPVLLPKLYLSCSVPSVLLLRLQLHIAFLIITSPQLFKISHSSMLPAVVFFPNAVHLQGRKKPNNSPTPRFRFLWTSSLLTAFQLLRQMEAIILCFRVSNTLGLKLDKEIKHDQWGYCHLDALIWFLQICRIPKTGWLENSTSLTGFLNLNKQVQIVSCMLLN